MDLKNIKSDDLKKYEKSYSEVGFFNKIAECGGTIGTELILKALQLWYVLQLPEVPVKVKAIIIGALGYLICPVDLIPDIIPLIGYSDDAAVIAFALLIVMMYIDDSVKEKASRKLQELLIIK